MRHVRTSIAIVLASAALPALGLEPTVDLDKLRWKDAYENRGDKARIEAAQATIQYLRAVKCTHTDDPVSWYYTLEEGRKLSAKKAIPYAVYVCAQPTYAVAGEGLTGWQEYKKQHNGAAPEHTIFEYREIHEALKTAGVAVLVKLEYKKETMEQMEQLGAVPGMLFLFAPNGERLEKFLPGDCTTANVINYLNGDFKGRLAAWKTRQEYLQSLEVPAPDKKLEQ
jgi:hypothetical protein